MIVEYQSILGKAVEMGSLDMRVSCKPYGVPALFIGGDKKDVWPLQIFLVFAKI